MIPAPTPQDTAYEQLCETFDAEHAPCITAVLATLRDLKYEWSEACERVAVSDDHEQLDGAIAKLEAWLGVK